MSEHVSAFMASMAAAGIEPMEPIAGALASGNPVRFQAKGDRKGRKNGWAMLHLDGTPAGAFGHWRMGIRSTWSASGNGEALSLQERRRLAASIRAIEAERQRQLAEQHREAAARAVEVWNAASRADPAHPYLVRKNLDPIGVRQSGSDLLVPMLDSGWRLWNLQRIRPDGFKLFGKGARTAGLFWPHGVHMHDGRPSAGPLVIGEGFATMAAIHSATRFGVVAAMSARNLETVARAMRKLFPSRELVIAADDDRHLTENIGLGVAKMAAQAVGGVVATPRPETCPADSSADFADIPRGDVAGRLEAARLGE